jgi:outer membrane lipase/esterase
MLSLVLRRPRAATLALAAVLTGMPQGTASAQATFSSLTTFGDSFSDSGNLFQAIGQPASPPYFQGRASNGPVWVEYFATMLGRPTDAAPAFALQRPSGNYAIAAARTAPVPGGAPSTGEQIAQYLTRPGAGIPPTDPTGLYVLFGGGNDLRDLGSLTDASLRRAAAAAAAMRVGTQAGQLATAGARNILLPSLPMLGSTPEARAQGRSEILDELTSIFNTTLMGQIATLRGTHMGTTFFDLRLDFLFTNILTDIRTGGGRYGFTNATVPCIPFFSPTPNPPSCDVSVFADAFHPTTKAHQIIADAAYARVANGTQVALIPEPATMVLFGSGLVLLVAGGTIRRRRATLG